MMLDQTCQYARCLTETSLKRALRQRLNEVTIRSRRLFRSLLSSLYIRLDLHPQLVDNRALANITTSPDSTNVRSSSPQPRCHAKTTHFLVLDLGDILSDSTFIIATGELTYNARPHEEFCKYESGENAQQEMIWSTPVKVSQSQPNVNHVDRDINDDSKREAETLLLLKVMWNSL